MKNTKYRGLTLFLTLFPGGQLYTMAVPHALVQGLYMIEGAASGSAMGNGAFAADREAEITISATDVPARFISKSKRMNAADDAEYMVNPTENAFDWNVPTDHLRRPKA